jgi:hypothetical protein
MDRSGAISFFVTLAASAVLVGCGTSTASTVDATASPDTTSGYGSPVVAGLIETDDIKESSGLSASECQDVLWTHNDSGDVLPARTRRPHHRRFDIAGRTPRDAVLRP